MRFPSFIRDRILPSVLPSGQQLRVAASTMSPTLNALKALAETRTNNNNHALSTMGDTEKAGVALALKAVNDSVQLATQSTTQSTTESSISDDQQKMQEMLTSDTFGVSSDNTERLVGQMTQAGVRLSQATLLDQSDQPGLIFSVNDQGSGLDQKNLMLDMVTALEENGIKPSVYTGHQTGGDLARFAHGIMAEKHPDQREKAITLTFDNAQALCSAVNQINVPLGQEAEALNGFVQDNDDSLEVLETASPQSTKAKTNPLTFKGLSRFLDEAGTKQFDSVLAQTSTDARDIIYASDKEVGHDNHTIREQSTLLSSYDKKLFTAFKSSSLATHIKDIIGVDLLDLDPRALLKLDTSPLLALASQKSAPNHAAAGLLLSFVISTKLNNYPEYSSSELKSRELEGTTPSPVLTEPEEKFRKRFAPALNPEKLTENSPRDHAIAVMADNGMHLDRVPQALQNNPELIKLAVDHPSFTLESTSDDMKNNANVFSEIAKKDGLELRFASGNLQDDLTAVTAAVKQNGLALRFASDRLKNDPNIVKEAVKQNGLALEFASDSLRSNPDVVKEAVKQDGLGLRHASQDCAMDLNIVTAAVQQNVDALEFASEAYKDDRTVVGMAVSQPLGDKSVFSANPLRFASPRLQDDRDIVKKAVEQNGRELEHASDDIKNDVGFVKELITQSPQSAYGLEFAPAAVKSDVNFVTQLVRQNGNVLRCASDALRDNETVLFAAMEQDVFAFMDASDRLKDNRDVIMRTMEQTEGMSLEYASARLKKSPELVIQAVRLNTDILNNVHSSMRDNVSVMTAAVEKDSKALRFARPEKLRNNQALVMKAVHNNGSTLQYASKRLQNNQTVVKAAISQDPRALAFASKRLQNNKAIVIDAIRQGGDSLLVHASPRLQNDPEVLQHVSQHLKNHLEALSDEWEGRRPQQVLEGRSLRA